MRNKMDRERNISCQGAPTIESAPIINWIPKQNGFPTQQNGAPIKSFSRFWEALCHKNHGGPKATPSKD